MAPHNGGTGNTSTGSAAGSHVLVLVDDQGTADNAAESVESDEVVVLVDWAVTGRVANNISDLSDFSVLSACVNCASGSAVRVPVTAGKGRSTTGLSVAQSVYVPTVRSLAKTN